MSPSLQELVNKHGSKEATDELQRLQASAHEAHIAWSVTAGYFEQSQQASKFFPALRPIFRKEMNEAAKVAKVRESFISALSGVRDELTMLLLDALVATDVGERDTVIQTALDTLAKMPIPGDKQ